MIITKMLSCDNEIVQLYYSSARTSMASASPRISYVSAVTSAFNPRDSNAAAVTRPMHINFGVLSGSALFKNNFFRILES